MPDATFRWSLSLRMALRDKLRECMAPPPESPPAVVRLFPRRKKDEHADESFKGYKRNERSPQLLDFSTIAERFCLVQNDAAKELGISVTTLKQVCRKLGIERWPGPKRRHHAMLNRDDEESQTSICNSPIPVRPSNLSSDLLSRTSTPKIERPVAFPRTFPIIQTDGLVGTATHCSESLEFCIPSDNAAEHHNFRPHPKILPNEMISIDNAGKKTVDMSAYDEMLLDVVFLSRGNGGTVGKEEYDTQSFDARDIDGVAHEYDHDLEWLMTIYSEPIVQRPTVGTESKDTRFGQAQILLNADCLDSASID